MSVHPTALVDPQAEIDPTATIGASSVIDGPVRIGPGCRIAPLAVVLGDTEIGGDCRIHSHAVIGDLPQDHAYEGEASFCRIGRGCVIREGVTVHRGTAAGSSTIIGDRCSLMTNSHVGHNCVLEEAVTLISGALLGGYAQVGRRAVISGNAAVHQFVRIGELAMVSGLAKIVQDVPPFFMTDRDGAIVGVNWVGLQRAGVAADDRREIKAVHRQIYRSGLDYQASLEHLEKTVSTASGHRLFEFLASESVRGITRDARRRRQAD
jgi:UDP-N-acetylglucosamine acyltransferase